MIVEQLSKLWYERLYAYTSALFESIRISPDGYSKLTVLGSPYDEIEFGPFVWNLLGPDAHDPGRCGCIRSITVGSGQDYRVRGSFSIHLNQPPFSAKLDSGIIDYDHAAVNQWEGLCKGQSIPLSKGETLHMKLNTYDIKNEQTNAYEVTMQWENSQYVLYRFKRVVDNF